MHARRIISSLAVVAMGVVALGITAPGAVAANKPGAACKKAGIYVHVGNSDLKCTKRGKKLVWVAVPSSGGPGGGASTAAPESGIASSAQIPKVIQNWGLDLAPYDPATGRAGVMQLAGVTPPSLGNATDDDVYKRIVGLYGAELRGRRDPQMTFVAPLGTPVISMVDGTVCDLPTLWSNDFSVRVAPTGTSCSGTAAPILFEHEHLIDPTVKVGDKVSAGQRIGSVSNFNSNWVSRGFGIIEVGIFFSKNDGSGKPWHACPSNYLAPAKADSLKATLSSIERGWMSVRNDPTMYNLAAQSPIGCLTSDDIDG